VAARTHTRTAGIHINSAKGRQWADSDIAKQYLSCYSKLHSYHVHSPCFTDHATAQVVVVVDAGTWPSQGHAE